MDGVHTDEVYFRDTAHGFLSWALWTVFVVGLLGSAISATISTGLQAALTGVSGAASAATSTANDGTVSYFVNSLLRAPQPQAAVNNADAFRHSRFDLINSIKALAE